MADGTAALAPPAGEPEALFEEAQEQHEWRALPVPPALHGQRIDRVLAACVPEFSRSYLQQLLAQDAVRVDGAPQSKPSARVAAGQMLRLHMRATQQSQAFRPEKMALDVVYEDEFLRIINKPAGLVVHPAAGHWSGTLLNGLLARDAQARLVPRAGIVHRLDKDTSGLMVVARTRAALDALVALLAARAIHREYLALAHGLWQRGAQYSVDAPIGRDPRNRLRMAVVDLARHAGKPARTDVQWLADARTAHGARVNALRCTLHTGRTHQIRVHLASLGHPLVGDALYGGRAALGLTRQALHAARLAFVHPISGAPMQWRAPPPPDLAQALRTAGLEVEGSL